MVRRGACSYPSRALVRSCLLGVADDSIRLCHLCGRSRILFSGTATFFSLVLFAAHGPICRTSPSGCPGCSYPPPPLAISPPPPGRPSLPCFSSSHVLCWFVLPICFTHGLALLSHYYKSSTCVCSVIFSLQRRCMGVLCCYFRPKMFSPGDHVRYHSRTLGAHVLATVVGPSPNGPQFCHIRYIRPGVVTPVDHESAQLSRLEAVAVESPKSPESPDVTPMAPQPQTPAQPTQPTMAANVPRKRSLQSTLDAFLKPNAIVLLASVEGTTFCFEIPLQSPPPPGRPSLGDRLPPPPGRPPRANLGVCKGGKGYLEPPWSPVVGAPICCMPLSACAFSVLQMFPPASATSAVGPGRSCQGLPPPV